MKNMILLAVSISLALPVIAAQDDDEPPQYKDRSEAREAYRHGYERGYDRGFQRGLAEGRRQAVAAPPPPPPPAPAVALGPIRITGAFYGTSSRNCNATRWLARRADGHRTYSVKVTNDICGDPAHGDRKSLEVTYLCGTVARTASSREHQTIYLSCS